MERRAKVIRKKRMRMLRTRVFACMISFALTLAVLLAGIKIMAAVTRADEINPRVKSKPEIRFGTSQSVKWVPDGPTSVIISARLKSSTT